MSRIHKPTIATLLVSFSMLMLVTGCQQPLPPLKIQPGQTVTQDLDVQDVTGKGAKLSLATGKLLILNVWATWCGPCRHEMPSLDRLAQKLDTNHYVVVGLSVDSDDHLVREFLIERKVGFSNYLDPTMAIATQVFGIRAFPSTLVFAPDGRLLEVIEGWREWDNLQMINRLTNLNPQATQSLSAG